MATLIGPATEDFNLIDYLNLNLKNTETAPELKRFLCRVARTYVNSSDYLEVLIERFVCNVDSALGAEDKLRRF